MGEGATQEGEGSFACELKYGILIYNSKNIAGTNSGKAEQQLEGDY